MLLKNPLIDTLSQRHRVSQVEINPSQAVVIFCLNKCCFPKFLIDFTFCYDKISNNRITNLEIKHRPGTDTYMIKIYFSLDGVYTPINVDFVHNLKGLFNT